MAVVGMSSLVVSMAVAVKASPEAGGALAHLLSIAWLLSGVVAVRQGWIDR